MLTRELVELVNSGEAIAVVGSGVSVGAKVPSWGRLFGDTADRLDSLGLDTSAARALQPISLPQAFDALAGLVSREHIHAVVRELIQSVTSPGEYHKQLSDWPFRLYVTTNYDCLIERANSSLVPVGNRGSELLKLSAGVEDVVWHMHGATSLSADLSQLVVTKADYDDFYPDSNAVQKLKVLAGAHRCVFFGFGFQDEDFMCVLRSIGRVAHAGRPSYAFLGYENVHSPESVAHRSRLLQDYNVEVIPYQTVGHDHSALRRLLSLYDPFIVRKSLSLGLPRATTPDYVPLTASLRVQASLDLGEVPTEGGLRAALIGARVLSLIRERDIVTSQDVLEDCAKIGVETQEVTEILRVLESAGSIAGSKQLRVTELYEKNSAEAKARVELAHSRFTSSVEIRAKQRETLLDGEAERRVTSIVIEFMADLCSNRGLGVAQNLATSDKKQSRRRAISLVQSLGKWLAKCSSREEAIAVTEVTADLLTSPTESEREFLGLLCQVYFGQHLIGASAHLAQVDVDLISNNCYILDASVLICLLAENGDSHRFITDLIRDLRSHQATLATTDLLAEEVLEHVRWALRLVGSEGENSTTVLDALRGNGAYRMNQFLSGYFSGKSSDATFGAYIGRIFSTRAVEDLSIDDLNTTLKSLGIQIVSFSDWDGFVDQLYFMRDTVVDEIRERRIRHGSYRHDRQILAEAEVAIAVDGIRKEVLAPPDASVQDAYFVSSTRVVDQLPELDRRISLLPDGLAQWMWSSKRASPKLAALVFDQLLWDLAQNGMKFVDHAQLLRRFSGVVEAAEVELKSAIDSRRDLLLEKYGPDPQLAFTQADPLDIPRLATEVNRELIRKLGNEVAQVREQAERLRAEAKVSEKDRVELAKLRAEKEERKRRAEQKKRGASSSKGKRKR